ncbi:MAG: hypothetical protein IJR89_05430 [Clostridia bacterium]|nr:hypothetical protein [Clostridia bacterium]
MKKTRFFVFCLLALAAALLLSGCGEKLNKKTVEADPLAYVEEGGRLSLQKTPLASLSDRPDGKSVSGEISLNAEEDSIKVAFGADASAKKGYLKLDLTYDKDGEAQQIKGDLFLEGSKLILRSDFLTELFGGDTVGLDLNEVKEIKKTGTFQSLLKALDMTEEEFDQSLSETPLAGILDEMKTADSEGKLKEAAKKLEEALAKLAGISENVYEVTEVTEGTITFDGEELKTVVVAYSLRESFYREFSEALDAFLKEIEGILGEGQTEASEELGLLVTSLPSSSISELFEKMKITETGKAYLSAKTGALLRNVSEAKTTVDGEEVTVTSDLILGADPTVLPLPALDLRIAAKDGEVRLQAVSSYADNKLTVDGTVTSRENGGEKKEELSFLLEYGKDGAYTLTLTDKSDEEGKEKTLKITGVFKTESGLLEWTANIEENEDLGIPAISLSVKVRSGAEIPAAPACKDLLNLTEEELAPLLAQFTGGFAEDPEEEGFEDFADYAFYIVSDYAGMDDEALAAALTEGYAKNGCPDALSYLYWNFAQYRAADLIQNYGVPQPDLQALWDAVAAQNGTYEDLALAFEDAYLRVTAPTEDEIREFLADYREYGFESRQEAADYLKDVYGDYVTIPAA